MRAAIGLTALAAGAILTFAVNAKVPGINLALAGVIIMVAAVAGMIGPSRAAAWLRRRGWLGGPREDFGGTPMDDAEDDAAYPAYLLQDPAVLAAEVLRSVGANGSGGDRSVLP
jgi:hypothetical protein